ncbi:MAG: guanylate kinase [Leptospirales bacterium]|nr:guanylate kinase [Leptospirales bacterium]
MPLSDLSVVITAPSGTGKTTVIQELMYRMDELEFSVSATTRPKRIAEREGVDYYFISKEDFRQGIENDDFLEWAEVHENFYGTPKKEIDRINGVGRIPILDVDVQGSKTLKNKINNAVFILMVPPSLAVLEDRLRKRKSDSEGQIELRLEKAVAEMRSYPMFDYIIINDRLSESVSLIVSIIRTALHKTDKMALELERILEAGF